MTRPITSPGRQGCVRDVDEAIAATHSARPHAGAPAGRQAVWWHQTASTLDLIADQEADTTRAEGARADAEVARRLSRGLALTHADAVTAATAERATELADVDERDDLEVSWP